MVLPRPALIAILGGVLVLAVFAFTRVAGQAEDDTASVPATDQTAQPATAPQQARSGTLSVRLSVRDVEGTDGLEGLTAEFGGPFESQGPTTSPKFDFDLKLTAPGEEPFAVGAVSTGDRGFVTSGDDAFLLPDAGWQRFTAMRAQFAELGRQALAEKAPKQPTLDLESLLVDGRRIGTETIDGVETLHTSGEVDVRRALRSLGRAASSLGGPELAGVAKQVERVGAASIDEVRADRYVGRDDGIMRRFRLEIDVAVPRRYREAVDGLERATIEVTIDVTGVNAPQQIAAPPATSEPGPRDVEAVTFGSGILGGAIAAVDPAPGADRIDPSKLAVSAGGGLLVRGDVAAGEGLPARVARGLARKDVVVLLFTQSGADDDATRDAVRKLRGLEDVTVVTDRIQDIGDYRRVVSELGIQQAPAVVIVDREGKARLVEGYTDPGSLAQQVEDAR